MTPLPKAGQCPMTEIPEAALRARQMYAGGDTIAAIRAETKLKFERLCYWVDGGNGRLPPLPRRRLLGRGLGKTSSRASLIRRMMRAAEQQLREVEQRLATAGLEPADPERNARALAILARTMRELTALDALNRARTPASEAKKSNDDSVPRNIDELRAQLLQKMDALIAEDEADAGNGPVA
jgi:hypothetical protein